MIDANILLPIVGILTIIILALVFLTRNKMPELFSETSSNLPVCKTIKNPTGLVFYAYDEKNSQIKSQLTTLPDDANTVSIKGPGAILVRNLTGTTIDKFILSIQSDDSIKDMWIFTENNTENNRNILAINTGKDIPYKATILNGEGIVISMQLIKPDTTITISIDSIIV